VLGAVTIGMELKKQAINLVGDFMVDWYIARNTSNFNFLYQIEIDCFFLLGHKQDRQAN